MNENHIPPFSFSFPQFSEMYPVLDGQLKIEGDYYEKWLTVQKSQSEIFVLLKIMTSHKPNVVSFITNNFYFMKSQQLAQQGSTYILTKPASQFNGALD